MKNKSAVRCLDKRIARSINEELNDKLGFVGKSGNGVLEEELKQRIILTTHGIETFLQKEKEKVGRRLLKQHKAQKK